MLSIAKRTCRSCGKARTVMEGVDRCPECGSEYGRFEIGRDRQPSRFAETAEAWPEQEPLGLVDGQLPIGDKR